MTMTREELKEVVNGVVREEFGHPDKYVLLAAPPTKSTKVYSPDARRLRAIIENNIKAVVDSALREDHPPSRGVEVSPSQGGGPAHSDLGASLTDDEISTSEKSPEKENGD